MSKYFLAQVVEKSTRGNTILDVVLTNAANNEIIEVDCSATCLSGHSLVSIKLGYNALQSEEPASQSQLGKDTFHS